MAHEMGNRISLQNCGMSVFSGKNGKKLTHMPMLRMKLKSCVLPYIDRHDSLGNVFIMTFVSVALIDVER